MPLSPAPGLPEGLAQGRVGGFSAHSPSFCPGPPASISLNLLKSLCLSGFLSVPIHSCSLLPSLSSAPFPQAKGGENRWAWPRSDPEHPRGPDRQRRGREPGMEARRTGRETERAGLSPESLGERVCRDQGVPGG